MYGLDSLTEHSKLNVEFSRESVSFMWIHTFLLGRARFTAQPLSALL